MQPSVGLGVPVMWECVSQAAWEDSRARVQCKCIREIAFCDHLDRENKLCKKATSIQDFKLIR